MRPKSVALTLAAGLICLWPAVASADHLAAGKQLIEKGDLRGADAELRAAAREEPDNAEARYRLAATELSLGNAVAAEQEARKARELGFDVALADAVLTQAYLAQGRFRDLLRDFPVEGTPPAALTTVLVGRGLAQLALDQLDAAAASIAEAEKRQPHAIEPLLAEMRLAAARHDEAAIGRAVERALAVDPRSTTALVMKARLLTAKGDRAGALAALGAAVASGAPDAYQARLERADLLIAAGQDAKAKEDVDAALAARPGSAQGTYLRTVLLVRAGEYKAANVELQKLSGVIAEFPRGYFLQALVKNQLGETAAAEDAAMRYAARHPADGEGARLLGTIEMAAGRPSVAIEALERAVTSGVKDAAVFDLLGRAYALTGQPGRALQAFQQAVALAPDDPRVLRDLAEIRLTLGEASPAAGELEHALELAPAPAQTWEMLVVAALGSGDLARASAALEALRKRDGASEGVGTLAGVIKLAELDLAGARAEFEAVLKAHPDAVGAKLNLAKLAALEGQPQEAARLVDEMLAKDPTNSAALADRISRLLQEGRSADAVAAMELAHKAAPTDLRLTAQLAGLYTRTGAPKRALAVVADLPKGVPAIPALLFAQAAAEEALGKAADARASYRELLALFPHAAVLRLKLMQLALAAKDTEAARAVIDDGIRAEPHDYALLQAAVGIDLTVGGLEQALAHAERLAADPAHLPEAGLLKGDIATWQKRFSDAAAAYATALKAAPSSAGAVRLAQALSAEGKQDAASAQLREWLAQHPDDAEVAAALSLADIAARRLDDAAAHLTIVLAHKPDNAAALNNLAWVKGERGDPAARATAQRAYLLAPGPQTADTLGWILTKENEAARALPLLRHAGLALPNDPEIGYHLAVALERTGEREAAIKLLTPLAAKSFADHESANRLLAEWSAVPAAAGGGR